MEGELRCLGDPSGQQSSDYWDPWFTTVNRSCFEWYCSVNEASRIVREYLSDRGKGHNETVSFFHPGSGNSRLPQQLWSDLQPQPSVHHVLDISAVGLQQLVVEEGDAFANSLVLAVGDVLVPPLVTAERFPSSGSDEASYDFWIDKGLIDALFSGKDIQEDDEKCSVIFREAHRLLALKSGIMMVISMAEQHSLQLILSKLDQRSPGDGTRLWQRRLHIHELQPLSGQMLPFAIILFANSASTPRPDEGAFDGKGHGDDNNNRSPIQIQVFHLDGRTTCVASNDADASLQNEEQTMFKQLEEQLNTFRQNFRDKKETGENFSPSRTREKQKRRLLATLELKPSRSNVNLNDLGRQITSKPWIEGGERGVEWYKDSRVVPVGFGISKLILQCIVSSTDDLTDLCTALQAEFGVDDDEGDSGDEDVAPDGMLQSIDVDWDKTVPLGDLGSLLAQRSNDQIR